MHDQLPVVPRLTITATPEGFTVAPRGAAGDLWVEAIVWLLAFVGFGLAFWLGGDVLRVIAAICLVGVGIRALVRVVGAVLGGRLRTLRIRLRAPQPALAGPYGSVALAQLARLEVGQRRGMHGLIATTAGKEHWLVDIAAPNLADYRTLVGWIEQNVVRPSRPNGPGPVF